jgi:tRNA uridine 5-carbamoylmethylation protein Kti12
MKKISVNSATLYEAIKTNSVQPNTNVKMNIDVTDDVIAISIEENFGVIQEAYLVAYDKKVGAVLAYQEIIGNNNNEFLIVPTDDFVDDINKIDGFKYARLCMAIKSNDMY